ncbi:MAG: hypothetical protein IJ298_05565 [Ruminococcus sp.]|nr:hypothetical protein [Ruminococcus sp.]
MSLVIGIFALCCLISPVVSLIKNLDADMIPTEHSISSSDITELYDERVLKATGDYINSYIDTLLIQAEIDAENIVTVLGVDENNGIYIKELNIYINKKDTVKADSIIDTVNSMIGIKPKITEM